MTECIGELNRMCSLEEEAMRLETRQVDIFEISQKFVKKYQRSSADKKYLPHEIRTVQACEESVEYLLNTVLDFDVAPKPGFSNSCYSANYFDIYSFLRDRLRAVRVDLHVQNCVTNPVFVRVHEICLRFELLSLFLLWGRDFGGERKFDLHMSLTALSQTIDPLTNAWSHSLVDAQRGKSASLILLLSLTSSSSKQFKSQFLRQPKSVQESPEMRNAFEICEFFFAKNWAQFLAKFEALDFLSSCALLPVLSRARVGLLRTMVRTNRPFFVRQGIENLPQPRPECIDLDLLAKTMVTDSVNAAEFARFCGLEVHDIVVHLPPRQLSRQPFRWWLSSAEWRAKTGNDSGPEFAWANPEVFASRLGDDETSEEPPQRVEPHLAAKFNALGMSRSEIVSSEKKKKLRVQPTFSAEGADHFVSQPIPKPPPPTRPIVPIAPLMPLAKPEAVKPEQPTQNFQPVLPVLPVWPVQPVQHVQPVATKRDRESPLKDLPSLPSPKRKPAEPAPVLCLPVLPSDFDLLAEQLETALPIRADKSQQIFLANLEAEKKESERESQMGKLRTRFVALKCLRNWQALQSCNARWRPRGPQRLI